MEKQTKLTYVLFFLSAVAIVLHNAVSVYLKTDEGISFISAMVLIGLFILSVVFNMATYLKKKQPTDVWKLGFLGLIGLIGFLPWFGVGFFGFYGFFGFFGLKK